MALAIGLDFLTALEVDPPELVHLAARYGIPSVNLLVQPFAGLPYHHLLGDTGMRRRTRDACRATGVTVEMAEPFLVDERTDPQDFRPGFETGAYLGACWVNLLSRDTDRSRLADRFAEAAVLAAEYGLGVLTEYHRRASLRTIAETVAFLREYGLNDVRVEVDALHFFRFDGDVENLRVHRDWIARAQICDGPAHMPIEEQAAEASTHRLPPGEGEFALQAFVDALPDGITLGIEVPHRTYALEERIERSLAGTRRLLGQSG
jgi:sugar phosphate isomerase/epimerase